MRYLAKCTGDSVYGHNRSVTFVPTNQSVVLNAITLIYDASEGPFEVGEICIIEISDKQSDHHDLGNPVG